MAKSEQTPMQHALTAWLAANSAVSGRELARMAKVDPANLSRLKSGEQKTLDAAIAARLALAMGISTDDLMAGRHEPSAAPGTTRHAGAKPDADAVLLPLDLIDASPFNPRPADDPGFAAEELDELGVSILSQGLLQPLPVRPLPGGRYELTGGERRWRALKRLAAKGKWDAAAYAVRATVRTMTEAEALEAQIVENWKRADPSPAAQADAIVRLQSLDPKKYTAKVIAERLGLKLRLVQIRLQVGGKLTPEAHKLFAEGKINAEAARVLAGQAPERQAAVLKHASSDWQRTPDALRRSLIGDAVPAEAAAFDPALYIGEIVEADGKRYFADKALFLKLQREEAERQLAAYAGKRGWTEAFPRSTYDLQRPVSIKAAKAHGIADEQIGAVAVLKFDNTVEYWPVVVRNKDWYAAEEKEREAEAAKNRAEAQAQLRALLARIVATTEALQETPALARRVRLFAALQDALDGDYYGGKDEAARLALFDRVADASPALRAIADEIGKEHEGESLPGAPADWSQHAFDRADLPAAVFDLDDEAVAGVEAALLRFALLNADSMSPLRREIEKRLSDALSARGFEPLPEPQPEPDDFDDATDDASSEDADGAAEAEAEQPQSEGAAA